MQTSAISRPVKIIRQTARYVTVFFVDRKQTVRLPLQFFRKRLAMGLFEVVNQEEHPLQAGA